MLINHCAAKLRGNSEFKLKPQYKNAETQKARSLFLSLALLRLHAFKKLF